MRKQLTISQLLTRPRADTADRRVADPYCWRAIRSHQERPLMGVLAPIGTLAQLRSPAVADNAQGEMKPTIIPSTALFCVGVHMMYTMGIPFRDVWRARRWSRAPGRVLSVGFHTGHIDGPDALNAAATPVVRYEYVVDSQRYEGTRVNFVGFSITESVRAKMRYEKAPEVMVWYDPRDPSSCVLEPRATARGVLFGMLALAVFLGSTGWILASIG